MNAIQTPRRRTWVLLFSVVIAVTLVLTAWVAFMPRDAAYVAANPSTSGSAETPANESPEETPAAPLNLPTPTPGTIEPAPVEVEKVSEAASAVIEAQNQIGQRADGSAVGAEAVATGFVLGELQSFAQEQLDLGYRQVGEAKVTEVTVVSSDLNAAVPVMTLAVCVDVSDVDVVDAAGNSYKAALYNPGHPVKHIYGAEFLEGTWKLSTHDIPDLQDCPGAA